MSQSGSVCRLPCVHAMGDMRTCAFASTRSSDLYKLEKAKSVADLSTCATTALATTVEMVVWLV